MKNLITILLLFSMSFSYSQSVVDKTLDAVSSTVDSVRKDVKDAVVNVDTAGLYKTMYNDAKSGIQGLASALKVGAEHVYKVLVVQQLVKSITWLLTMLLPFIILVCIWKRLLKWAKEQEDDSDGFSWLCAITVIILLLIPSIVGFCYMDTIVTGFVNPEFGAMQQIMEWVNPSTK